MLPNEWHERRLGDLTLRIDVWNPRTDGRETIRYIDVSGVSREKLIIVDEAQYSAESAPSRARKIVKAGDTIFATVRPTLRRIAQIPDSLDGEIVSTAFCVLRPNKEEINPDFLFFAAQLDGVMSAIAACQTGASYPAVRDSDVLNQTTPVPPLAEQEAIAGVLKAIRSALLVEDECGRHAAELKRAAMRELFTHGLRGEPQKESESGKIPESWLLTPTDQIFKLTSGKTRPSQISPELTDDMRFPVIGGNGIMGYSPQWHLDSDKVLVIGRVGEYCGAVHVASGKVWITDNALYAKDWLHAAADVRFVAEFLKYFDLNRFKRMAGQPLVTQGMISEHSIPLPSIDEQREIVTILDAIDRKIDLHKRKRAVLEELFKALLHKLMTGQIRVAELDLSAIRPASELAEA
jgi:type I restriction enzyme, S subunit